MSGSGSWRTVIGIGIAWPLILIVGMIFMPESPRWLARHGKMDKTRLALARVRGVPTHEAHDHWIIRREADEIQSQAEYDKQIQSGWLDCFRPRGKTLYRTLLGTHPRSLERGLPYLICY
jgi:SP family sugar:H+ symporter-like MFS transporter